MDVKLGIIVVLVLTSSLALDNSTLTDMYIQISSDVGTLKTRTDVIEQQLIGMTSSLESQGGSVQQLVDLYEQNVIPNFVNESLLRIFVVGVVLLNAGVNAMLVIYLAGVVKKYGKQGSTEVISGGGVIKKSTQNDRKAATLNAVGSPAQKVSLFDKLKSKITGKQVPKDKTTEHVPSTKGLPSVAPVQKKKKSTDKKKSYKEVEVKKK